MKVHVYSLDGEPIKEISLPSVFQTPVRPDLIRRAFWIIFTHSLQPQGRDPLAGKRRVAESWGPGYGVARIPRIKGSNYPAAAKGAFAVGTVGGRRGHPPTSKKRIRKEINKKERILATKSAIAATAIREIVAQRGHKIEEVPELPLVVSDEIESLKRTKEVIDVLENLGMGPELERASKKKVRAGKGKMRGRRYKRRKGPLIVVKEDKGISKAANNIPGVDVVLAKDLNVLLLAPGGHPGRLTVWSESAIEFLREKFG